MTKSAIRYHRFSSDNQSVGSLERQAAITGQWCKNSEVTIRDTFEDDGWSAKNFDRPDIKKLFDLLKKQTYKIDYLIVAELTRFSRDLGEAITLVKKIQTLYGVKIVSAGRNTIYDCSDSTSFFMMSIEFTLGNTENLKREADINGGIYTAKGIDKRYIGPFAPYGYRLQGKNKERKLVVYEPEAKVVEQIFNSFLHNTSISELLKIAQLNGMNKKGNSVITKMLTNVLYTAQQHVKPWKGMAGGLLPVNHEPIIDMVTFAKVQKKLKEKDSPKVSISTEMPLRGLLHCHCGRMLTGAPSRGRHGNYYYYYKCYAGSIHNNVSAAKLHQQVQDMLTYLSVPTYIVDELREVGKTTFKAGLEANKTKLAAKKIELAAVQQKLYNLEEKYIVNEIAFATYNRWYSDYNQQLLLLNNELDLLSQSDNSIIALLEKELTCLTDLKYLYNGLSIVNQQLLLNIVFDAKLYYRNGLLRTPYLIEIFHPNLLILKEKKLLELDEKRDFVKKSLEVDVQGVLSNPLIELLSFFRKIRVA